MKTIALFLIFPLIAAFTPQVSGNSGTCPAAHLKTCYSGPAAEKATNGCANVTVDCKPEAPKSTCPAQWLGGCHDWRDCSYSQNGYCTKARASYDATCYNGPVARKVTNGCKDVAINCYCTA